ncbi:DM13 domain-containing protein [Paraglaciecola marina]|uniref:DM13 domain-containing protein n=1 Tax=Paraglaciecola marina TaxID=2500157 RepID=UPI001061C2C7|nr:DM13 domain-containing protein [Paraglaciecola marina]
MSLLKMVKPPVYLFLYWSVFLITGILLLLTGCGGSGGDTGNQSPTVPTVLTGVFVDSAVQGLTYSTATQSGTTNEDGEFSYIQGEAVIFSIGDIQFPSVIAQTLITPLDVFSVTTVNDIRVSNMARLLQTLDHDGIQGNGITITDEAHNQAVGVDINFAATDFASQVEDLVANAGAVNTSLISEQDAIEHLNLALGNMATTRGCTADSTKIGYTGTFSTLAHSVSGKATVIDDCTLEITQFNFDGAAPNVRFYGGINGNFTDSEAFAIGERLDGRSYTNETILLELPEGKFVDDLDSVSVWCVAFSADFGNLRLEAP